MSCFPTWLLYSDRSSISPGETLVCKAIMNHLLGSMNNFRKHYHQPCSFYRYVGWRQNHHCYGRFINGCKTLCEWAKWMNLTWLCQLHWFCLIAPKTLLPLKALLSIRRLHNPIYSGECVLSRGARHCALKYSRMLTSRCSVLRTVHSRARWRHVNHVRPH